MTRAGARARWPRHLTALLVVLVALLAACTPDDPSEPDGGPTAADTIVPDVAESPGPQRIAVVVAPVPEVTAAAAAAGVRAMGSSLPDGTELRVVVADGAGFLGDIVRYLAGEGYDLVCAVGPNALPVILDIASDVTATRFCATPAIADVVPDNVIAVDLRVEEVAYLAGLAAGLHDPAQGPLMVTGPAAHAVGRQQRAFRSGLAAGAPASPAPFVGGPVATAEDAEALVAGQLAAGASVIYTDAGAADAGVLAAAIAETAARASERDRARAQAQASPSPSTSEASEAAGTGIAVIGGPDLGPAEDGAPFAPEAAFLISVRLDVAVRIAIDALLGGWQARATSVGLQEGALQLAVIDTGPIGAETLRTVEQARADIVSGQLVVLP